MKFLASFLFIIGLVSEQSWGQIICSGKVLDATNLQPLVGANIYIDGSQVVAISDDQGYFELTVPSEENAVTISHIGYLPQVLTRNQIAPDLKVLMRSDEYELPQLLVTGTASSKQLLRNPTAISIIPRQALNRDNQTNIAEPLNRIPGLYMHSGTLNTNRITVRGIGSRSLFSTTKIRAYLNDIPLTTGDGETTLEDIDLSLLDRVEILKGPASSIYGAGLGGTINMKAARAPYGTKSLSSELTLGSFGLVRSTTSVDLSEDKYNIRLNFSSIHQDGYRDNNEYDRRSLSLLSQVYPGKNNVLTFWGTWIDLLGFIPSSLDSAAFAEDPTQAAFTWGQTMGFEDYNKGLLGLNFQQGINTQWDISVSLFGNLRSNYELRPFNILDEDSKAFGSRLSSNYAPQVNKGKLNWILGAEYFDERYQWQTIENVDRNPGELLSDNDEDRIYYNVFTELSWDLPAGTLLTAGVNFNHTEYQYQDLFLADGDDLSGSYEFESQWSPRIAVNHTFDDQRSLYAQISHGFSPPTLSETLTPDGAINPDIQPETGFNYELGSRGHLLNTRLWYDVSIYTMRIRNLLVARRTGDDIFVGVNAGKTTHSGLDVAINYEAPIKNGKVHLWTTYAFADYIFKEFVDEGNDYSGNELTGTPRHKFNLGADFTHDIGFFANLNLLSVGSMPIRDDNSVYSEAYSVMNLKAGYQSGLGRNWAFKIFAGINNIWDEKYASMLLVNASSFGGRPPRYFYPGLPRHYYGGISLSYTFRQSP